MKYIAGVKILLGRAKEMADDLAVNIGDVERDVRGSIDGLAIFADARCNVIKELVQAALALSQTE